MNWRLFFERNLTLGKRLSRLHHANAIMFLILSITGFILFSSTFRSTFPSIRVWVRDVHVWIGFISCLPLFFYFPKMKMHLKTIREKYSKRNNLHVVLTVLIALIVSGVFLTFHRQFPPIVSTWALFIHDIATWFGVPYALYHSVTRSKWYKKLEQRLSEKRVSTQEPVQPLLIEDHNPVYTRRTFMRIFTGGVITIAFFPVIANWLKAYSPSIGGTSSTTLPDGNQFTPLPEPSPQSSPPIGGGRHGEFRYYTVTEVPELSNDNWSLSIDGLVERQKKYNWTQFVDLKRNVQVSDFHCVTGWSVYSITWEGIPLKKLLQEAGVKQKAKYVKFYSADGVYTDTLSLDLAMQNDIMVATLIDGELIRQKNGGPVRLIVPKMYAYKSVKWLNRIELIADEHIGYWEQRGYPNDAWVN